MLRCYETIVVFMRLISLSVAVMKLKMILRGICFFKFPPFADGVEVLCYLISVATALTKRRLDVMPAKSDESATLSLG